MDVQTILLKLKDWFEDYTSGFYSDEPMVQQNMMLKVEHTRRVCEAILMIGGGSLDLSNENLSIAETCALLHDIGRFEQYKQYRTFMGWVYDLNFPMTFRIVREKKFLESIRDALPTSSSRVQEIYKLVQAHVTEKLRQLKAISP